MDRPRRETKAADRLIANPNFGLQGKPNKSEKEIANPANKRPSRKQQPSKTRRSTQITNKIIFKNSKRTF